MGTQDIYKNIANKLLQGIMIHQELITYYDFLALQGYKTCQKYHYLEQVRRYEDFNSFYMEHANRLIPKHFNNDISSTSIIPDNWYEHTRYDVNPETKKNAIKNGFEKWLSWQENIKKFLEQTYLELINSTEISAALKIQEYICDVDEELKHIQKQYLKLEAINFDLSVIVEKQWYLKKKYEKKMNKDFEKGKGEKDVESSRS